MSIDTREKSNVNIRSVDGFPRFLIRLTSVSLTIWLFYVLFVHPVDTLVLRATFTSVISCIGFLLYPAFTKSSKNKIPLYDWILGALSIAILVYLLIEFRSLIFRTGVSPTNMDLFFGLSLILLILEMSRRTTGFTLPVLSIIFLLYTLLGKNLPGILGHPGYSFSRMVSFLFGVQGIYNIPLGVIATFVFLFILFGTLLQLSGGGQAIIDISKAIAGGYRGGPAKVAIISSSLFGSISGAAVANVAVTGTFTIPMMKKTGYPGFFAAAVESVASTGGQITPPVLGAAAFLMAEILGTSYTNIVLASIIPALLFYVSLFCMVDFEGAKQGLKGLPKSEIPSISYVFKHNGYLLLPILVLMFFLVVVKLSPLRSAMWSCLSVIILSFFNRRNAITFKRLLNSFVITSESLVTITATAAAAGIVIGTMSLSGLGHRFAIMLISYSGGNVLIALILSMIISLLLGTGLPPVAAYAIAGTAIGPALVELGIEPLSAHLFIFYFCAISVITPPVALAAYTAAALAGENMWKVGSTAFRIGIAAYLVPYLFVFEPSLLFKGGIWDTLICSSTAIIGVVFLAAAVQGWLVKTIKPFLRIMLVFVSIALIFPGGLSDVIGFAMVIFTILAIKTGFGIKK